MLSNTCRPRKSAFQAEENCISKLDKFLNINLPQKSHSLIMHHFASKHPQIFKKKIQKGRWNPSPYTPPIPAISDWGTPNIFVYHKGSADRKRLRTWAVGHVYEALG